MQPTSQALQLFFASSKNEDINPSGRYASGLATSTQTSPNFITFPFPPTSELVDKKTIPVSAPLKPISHFLHKAFARS